MSLLKSRLVYDMLNLTLYENDSYLLNFNMEEEFKDYKSLYALFLQYGLKEIKNKTFDDYFSVVKANCLWAFSSFYTEEEINVMSYYLLCSSLNRQIWEQGIDDYLKYLNVDILNFSEKKEVISCLFFIKKQLLNYYIGFNLNDEKVESLFNELLPLSKEYEYFNNSYTSLAKGVMEYEY